MEESLTLSELLRLYSTVRKKEIRQYKMHLRAQGADVEVFDDTPADNTRDPDAFRRIQRRIDEKGGNEKKKKGGSPFGVGIGFKSN